MNSDTPRAALSDADIKAIHARVFQETVKDRFNTPIHFARAILAADADRRLTAEQPAWRFERLDASKRIIATEPNGTEHILAKAELGSVAATTLFDRMAVALSARPSVTAEQGGADERANFDVWAKANGFGRQAQPTTWCWQAWQARAALTTQPQAEQGGFDAWATRVGHDLSAKPHTEEHDAWRLCKTAREAWRAALTTQPQAEPTERTAVQVTDEMVSRFLCWRLPDEFSPDCGINFTPFHPNATTRFEPVGTNLLTAEQARQMLEHVLGSAWRGLTSTKRYRELVDSERTPTRTEFEAAAYRWLRDRLMVREEKSLAGSYRDSIYTRVGRSFFDTPSQGAKGYIDPSKYEKECGQLDSAIAAAMGWPTVPPSTHVR